MSIQDNGNGYKKVQIKNKCHYIHRLVAEHFLENSDNLPQVDHIDRNKSNNNVSNLKWVSAKQNIKNTAGKNRYSVERKHVGKHCTNTVNKIRSLYQSGTSVMEISRKLNIPRQSVSRFVKDLREKRSK